MIMTDEELKKHPPVHPRDYDSHEDWLKVGHDGLITHDSCLVSDKVLARIHHVPGWWNATFQVSNNTSTGEKDHGGWHVTGMVGLPNVAEWMPMPGTGTGNPV